jgi:hypothetical protein
MVGRLLHRSLFEARGFEIFIRLVAEEPIVDRVIAHRVLLQPFIHVFLEAIVHALADRVMAFPRFSQSILSIEQSRSLCAVVDAQRVMLEHEFLAFFVHLIQFIFDIAKSVL